MFDDHRIVLPDRKEGKRSREETPRGVDRLAGNTDKRRPIHQVEVGLPEQGSDRDPDAGLREAGEKLVDAVAARRSGPVGLGEVENAFHGISPQTFR